MTTKAIEKYDVVIIGSGLAGLECGAILGKEGKKVCVVEKNEQIGGSLQTFSRDGVKFDTGVHYFGGLDKGQNLYMFFNYLGLMDRLELQKMDPNGFDVVMFGDDNKEYPYGMGYENFIRILSERFPGEENNIREYCREIRSLCDKFPLYRIRKGDWFKKQDVFVVSAKQYIESVTKNERLRSVLAGTNLLYAGVGDRTPLYMHALIVNSCIESAWKCVNGSDQIVKLLSKEIKRSGGQILRKSKVSKIHAEGELAQYAELENGTKIFGEIFISNMHPATTLEITDSALIRKAYRRRVKGLENSIAAFVIYATLKPNSYLLKNRNYYYFDENYVWHCDEYTEESWPYNYALFEGFSKPGSKYADSITIMCYMRFEEVQLWAGTFNTTIDEKSRGRDYEAFKKRKAEKLLDTVERKFPDIRKFIQSYYTSTPLSYRDYIGTTDGNMYGIMKDFNDPVKTYISPRTKIPNLYLTGQNVNLHGVLGVTVSAFLTCSMLLGKDYMIDKILEANEEAV